MLKRLDGEELVEAQVAGESVHSDSRPTAQDAESNRSVEAELVGQESSEIGNDPLPDQVATDLLFDDDSTGVAEDQSTDEEPAPSLWSQLSSGDSQAFLLSLIVHTVLILALALIPILSEPREAPITLTSLPATEAPEELTFSEDLAFAETPEDNMGANSVGGTGMALSTAAIIAEVPDVETVMPQEPVLTPAIDLDTRIQQAVGLVRSDVAVKGMTGVGATGTEGAIDQITYEILRSLEERPTLVVWFFDQSGSLQRRREEIRNRFERIYKELGIVQKAREEKQANKLSDEPLLTSIFAFGDKVTQLTEKPTADMSEIQGVIDSIQMDQTGNEKIFSAFYLAADKYKSYRTPRAGKGPERNVMFIALTDERGDDVQGLDATIRECRKLGIPVYVVGVPAPFGREFTYIKYVDPDPKFDQTPQWAQVDQGPESLMPERVKLGYRDNFYEEPVMDSGFGPYALSRLTYETGGIYFSVHPNRKYNSRVSKDEIDPFSSEMNYFFDPEIMAKYRPDYVSQEDYLKKVKESPLRQCLVNAARMAAVETLQVPRLRFVRRDEPSLVNDLTNAQQAAARLEPQLATLLQVLMPGQSVRDRETSPRWLAGYDLALATVMAHKVRAEAYNAMLAKAKRGMPFKDTKNNTWVLRPADEISVGSKLEKEGNTARQLLTDVTKQHAGTPWAILARRELNNPIGWQWVEEFTDLNPQPAARNNNNPPPPPQPARDDQARMLKPPPPKRPIPKL